MKTLKALAFCFFVLSATHAAALGKKPPIPSVQDQLDARKKEFAQKAPEQMKQAFQKGIEEVADSGVMESALKAGDTAPDFTLPAANGEPVNLYSVLEKGPAVVTWYRGGWCPYCNIYLRSLQQALPRFKEYGAALMAISPEQPDKTMNTTRENELSFPVLSDKRNRVARQFGIVYTLPKRVQKQFKGKIDLQEYNGDRTQELPLAVTYVIGQDKRIYYAFIDPDYKKRAEPEAILKTLKRIK